MAGGNLDGTIFKQIKKYARDEGIFHEIVISQKSASEKVT